MMKILNFLLSVVCLGMNPCSMLAMEMVTVTPADVENSPHVVRCLLCKKEVAAVVGLNRVYNGSLSIFAFCKNCLTREIKKKPHLFELFTCSCQKKLKETCLVHLVETPVSALLESGMPLVDLSLLSGGFKPWLKQQGREVATAQVELSDRLRDRRDCCYAPRWPLLWVSLMLITAGFILLIAYCPPCQKACCGDSCSDDKKEDCFYSCDSCTWGYGTLIDGMGLNLINILLGIISDIAREQAKKKLKMAEDLREECSAVWTDYCPSEDGSDGASSNS